MSKLCKQSCIGKVNTAALLGNWPCPVVRNISPVYACRETQIHVFCLKNGQNLSSAG